MKITLQVDLEKAKDQLGKIKEFKENLPSEKMYFRYPDLVDLETDFATESFAKKIDKLKTSFLEIRAELEEELYHIMKEHDGNDLNIDCYLVSLGTYGYFNEPEELYINVWDASVEHMLETTAHEALHLILSRQTKDMSYQETEEFIDGMFNRPALQKLFPKYEMQVF